VPLIAGDRSTSNKERGILFLSPTAPEKNSKYPYKSLEMSSTEKIVALSCENNPSSLKVQN
jgi:hypothetical protein